MCFVCPGLVCSVLWTDNNWKTFSKLSMFNPFLCWFFPYSVRSYCCPISSNIIPTSPSCKHVAWQNMRASSLHTTPDETKSNNVFSSWETSRAPSHHLPDENTQQKQSYPVTPHQCDCDICTYAWCPKPSHFTRQWACFPLTWILRASEGAN